jgi:hypothetical protein
MWDKYENISDELLAAFLDGNAIPIESLLVQNAIGNDINIAELINIASDTIKFTDELKFPESDSECKVSNIESTFKLEMDSNGLDIKNNSTSADDNHLKIK